MKKLFKALLLMAVVACCAVAVAFAGCGDSKKGETYTGEYHYASPYGFDYGIKVQVTVEDSKITKVTVVDSSYVEATDAETWGEENYDNWANNLDGLLAKYEGKTVAEIKAINVSVVTEDEATNYTPAGQPSCSASDLGELVIADATQGCGRLVLAVQNALKDVK